MDCKHENQYLMGTNDGIVCRRCGARFADYDELKKAIAPTSSAEEPKPKRSRSKAKEAAK